LDSAVAFAQSLQVIEHRLQHGLPHGLAVPSYVATDSYGKHRLGLKRIADAAAGLGKFQTKGATPRGPVERLLLHTDPTVPGYAVSSFKSTDFYNSDFFSCCKYQLHKS